MYSIAVQSQNLVPNPSFEAYWKCPQVADDYLGVVKDWFLVYQGTLYQPVYMHRCNNNPNSDSSVPENPVIGYQEPRTGDGMVFFMCYNTLGGAVNRRNYIQVKLNMSLKKDSLYCGSFYVNKKDFNSGAIANIGLLFSDTALSVPGTSGVSITLPEVPAQVENKYTILDDTVSWMHIVGSFRAKGGEQFMTVGNFRKDTNTITAASPPFSHHEMGVYYAFDDFCVTPAPAIGYQLELGKDSLYCGTFPGRTLTAPEGFGKYLWSTGDSVSTIQVSAPGVYWVECDLECCRFTDTIRLSFIPEIDHFNLGNDTIVCEGNPINLSGPPAGHYLWNTGATTRKIMTTAPGIYTLTAFNTCFSYADTIVINHFEIPEPIYLGKDTFNCAERQLVALDLDAGPDRPNYLWSTGETTSRIAVSYPGIYSVQSTYPCVIITDSIALKGCAPTDDYELFIPNVFSPDDDGDNDYFSVFSENIDFERVSVFDRWGALVFQSADPDSRWDGWSRGKACPAGVYICIVEFTTLATGKHLTKSKSVTLLK